MAAGNDDELFPFLLEVRGIEEAAKVEERHAGAGAYGYVFQVTVGGVRRVAKKLHSNFTHPSEVSAIERESITSKFRHECLILSKLRHPNIVQFIGVHYGRRGKADLTLIMECVSSDMDKFLEVHPNIPLPLKLSILLDVSYGLVYLHEYNPPVVHRDLTARNILISTDKCQAKIADLGVAKVVDIQAQMATAHTQVPGNMFYMPPEALVEKASCTPKLDVFSFGHLAIYTVNQTVPNVYRIRETSKMAEQGIVERLRRQTSLDCVGRDHCLYPIIVDCLFDEPKDRPTTRELNNRILHLSTQDPVNMEDIMQATSDMPSNVHQFCLQLSKLVDPEGQSLEVSPLALSTEALQSLESIGVPPNLNSRGYVVAVFQAYARAQSILLDYSQVGKGHEVLLDPTVGDHEKSPHTSLGEEKKSPFSSLGDVKMVVAEENMTDADKRELQEMLKESHEELERLWNHNKILVERLKAMEMQQHFQELSVAEDSEADSEVDESQRKVAELTERLRAYKQQLCYLPKPSKQERKAGTTDPLRQLKDEYLSMHTEKMSLLAKLEEQDAQLKEMREMLAESGKDKYLSMYTEKMSLLEKLEERDAQLKEMREMLAESGTTPTNYPRIECSPSLGALGSPENLKVEVYRLRSVIEEKEKKLENMSMQLKTFEVIANEKAGLEEQVEQLWTQLRTLEKPQNSEEDPTLEIVKRLSEVEAVKGSVIQENKTLRDDITAWKYKVDAVEEDFRKERNERENMAAKLDDEFGKWGVLEQQLTEQLEYSENKCREQVQKMNASEQVFQEELKRQKHRLHESQQREFQLTAKLDDQRAHAAEHQQEMDERLDRMREEQDIIRTQWNDMTTRYGEEKDKNIALQEENEHLQVHFTDLQAHTNDLETRLQNLKEQYQGEKRNVEDEVSQLKGTEEQLKHLLDEKQHVEERLVTQKLKHEKFLASMKCEFETKLHEITRRFSGEKGAVEQQRKHDYAEWMIDRRSLESAIGDTSRLSEEVMTLEQQLKHEKARIRHLEQLSKKKEEEHKEEVEIIRARYESLMMVLKREAGQLRQTLNFGDDQHSDTFRRMEAEARNELEILRGKYDGIMDGFMMARDLLIKHNIPLPKCGDQPTIGQPIMDETQVSAQSHQDMDPFVCPYVEPPPQLLPPSGDATNRSWVFHRLSDIDARKHATQRRISDRPPLDNYSSDPYGADQQNLVSQKMLNKAGYNKPGGYPEPISPNLATPGQHFQAPILRAQGEGGINQGRAPYSQQGGGAIHEHAYDQRSQPPVSEATPYQQPRYPPPQPHFPQGQQAMINAPQPQHAPPVHGHAPRGRLYPLPPSIAQGRRPPNPPAPQEKYLVKGIDAEIAAAAAGVRQEVTLVPAGEAWPLDSNLICPMCKKQYRIGQIQYYKQHVDKCEGEEGAAVPLQDLPPNEVDLDQDIKRVVSEVRRGMAVSSLTSSVPQSSRPLDSNLVCPKCKKQYRIGQIQHFRRHVDKCEGV